LTICKQWFIVNAKRKVKESKEITKRNSSSANQDVCSVSGTKIFMVGKS
jgi:hypothetical protein